MGNTIRMNASSYLDWEEEIGRWRNRLPHWQQAGVLVFVTWRLADSLPAGKLRGLEGEKEAWLRLHPCPWTRQTLAEYHARFTERIEAWLDAGHGACVLRQPALAAEVAKSLLHDHGKRVDLEEFVVMPNHVHALFGLRSGHALGAVIKDWKAFSALRINRLLGQSGTLWMKDYWDRLIRGTAHEERVRRYIRENPRHLRPGDFLYWRREAREGRPMVAQTKEGRPVVAQTKEGRPMVAQTKEGRPVVAQTKEGRPVVAQTKEGRPMVAQS
jgi:REP element-mobilizing transposase RayT